MAEIFSSRIRFELKDRENEFFALIDSIDKNIRVMEEIFSHEPKNFKQNVFVFTEKIIGHSERDFANIVIKTTDCIRDYIAKDKTQFEVVNELWVKLLNNLKSSTFGEVLQAVKEFKEKLTEIAIEKNL